MSGVVKPRVNQNVAVLPAIHRRARMSDTTRVVLAYKEGKGGKELGVRSKQ